MFDDMVITDQTKAQLEAIVANPPHALLIFGSAHLGKHLLARELAAGLLGVAPDKLDSTAGFRELVAVKNTVPIETVRDLLPFFSLVVPGVQTIKRVVLIPDADTMTTSAQNALLKVLEEPPTDAVIILTSSHVEKLLSTIRSRCQLCRIKQPPEDMARKHLEKDYDAATVKTALLAGGGTIGGAKRILDESKEEVEALQTAKVFLGLPLFEQLTAIDSYSKDREAATKLVSLLVTIAEKGMLHSRSKQWQQILQATIAADAALKQNANIKLVLTELALSLR